MSCECSGSALMLGIRRKSSRSFKYNIVARPPDALSLSEALLCVGVLTRDLVDFGAVEPGRRAGPSGHDSVVHQTGLDAGPGGSDRIGHRLRDGARACLERED